MHFHHQRLLSVSHGPVFRRAAARAVKKVRNDKHSRCFTLTRVRCVTVTSRPPWQVGPEIGSEMLFDQSVQCRSKKNRVVGAVGDGDKPGTRARHGGRCDALAMACAWTEKADTCQGRGFPGSGSGAGGGAERKYPLGWGRANGWWGLDGVSGVPERSLPCAALLRRRAKRMVEYSN